MLTKMVQKQKNISYTTPSYVNPWAKAFANRFSPKTEDIIWRYGSVRSYLQ